MSNKSIGPDESHPWRMSPDPEAGAFQVANLDDLFGYYSDSNIPDEAREGLIRSVMQVDKDFAAQRVGKEARRRIVEFLCDIGSEEESFAEENPQLRMAARATLVKHVLPKICDYDLFPTIRTVVGFYLSGELRNINPSYVRELSAQDRKRWEDAFRHMGGVLHNTCMETHAAVHGDHAMQHYCELLVRTHSWRVLVDVRPLSAISVLYDELRSYYSNADNDSRRLTWNGWKSLYQFARNGWFGALDPKSVSWHEMQEDVFRMVSLCGVGRDILQPLHGRGLVIDEGGPVKATKRTLLLCLAPFAYDLWKHWHAEENRTARRRVSNTVSSGKPPAHEVICDRLEELARDYEAVPVTLNQSIKDEACSLVKILASMEIPSHERFDVLNKVHALPKAFIPDLDDVKVLTEIAGGDIFQGLQNAE